MQIISKIVTNVLTALYQPFWFAVILSVLFMFVYKAYPSIKQATKDWISWFKSDSSFRRIFFLVFYTVMILFRTLLNRNMWANPLSNVIGVWGGYTGALKAPVRCFGNHLSEKRKSLFRTDNECGGASILKNRTSRMEDASWLLMIIRSALDPIRILLS